MSLHSIEFRLLELPPAKCMAMESHNSEQAQVFFLCCSQRHLHCVQNIEILMFGILRVIFGLLRVIFGYSVSHEKQYID